MDSKYSDFCLSSENIQVGNKHWPLTLQTSGNRIEIKHMERKGKYSEIIKQFVFQLGFSETPWFSSPL